MSTLDEIFGDGSDKKKAKGKTRSAGEMSPYELLKDKTGDELLLAALTDEKKTKSAGGDKLVADRARGIEFSDDGKTLLKYPDDLKDESYAVPEGVEVIGKNAFHEACFKNITFPGSLKRIEKEAFVWASEIREIILPEGLEEIGAAAFWCCPNLSGISIPRSVKEIGEYAFYGCSSLKKLVTSWDEPHGNVMTWRYHPFFGKSEEGEAPASLFSSPRVFHGCKNLLDVTGCDSVKSLVSEYQRRAANPLPEDDPECPGDYQFDDEW